MAAPRPVPQLRTLEQAKYAPRQAQGGASVDHPSPPRTSTTPRSTATPRGAGVSSTPRSRFSSRSQPMSPTGGTTLFVSGMGSARRERPESGSHMFRSTTSIADAHIKDCSLRIVPGPYAAGAPGMAAASGTAAFRSKSPSDRDAHIRPLMSSTFGSPRSPIGTPRSPSHAKALLPSASFRSASPNACAHILAMPKPTDASYDTPTGSARGLHRQGSASFRSTTSIADAHIKDCSKRIVPGPYSAANGRDSGRAVTSPFKSTTSIGDAHIKAVPKPVDLVVAYRE